MRLEFMLLIYVHMNFLLVSVNLMFIIDMCMYIKATQPLHLHVYVSTHMNNKVEP